MTRALLIGLAAVYSGYVALQLSALAPIVVALWLGLSATFALDPSRASAWTSCHALVLALLHLRHLPAEAPLAVVQVGLAAAVAASALLSLGPAPRAPRLRVVVPIAAALGGTVAFAGPGHLLVGALGGALAGLRPLGALGAIAGRAHDPWLAWSPLVGGQR